MLYRVRLMQGTVGLEAKTRSGAELSALYNEQYGIHLYVSAASMGILEDQFSPYLIGVDVLGSLYEIEESDAEDSEDLEKHVL